MAEWDYLIGSVHYLASGWDVDNPKHLFRFTEDSVESIWDRYWELFNQCVRSRLFDFVAHPDLPKKFGYQSQRRSPALLWTSGRSVAGSKCGFRD